MEEMLNPDSFDAPRIEFGDLPSGMGEKLEVGDTIVAKEGDKETTAKVIRLNEADKCAYLSKELPKNADYTVKETSTGEEAPYDAMQKAASSEDSSKTEISKDALTGPLPDLKKILIQISIEQGDCNE